MRSQLIALALLRGCASESPDELGGSQGGADAGSSTAEPECPQMGARMLMDSEELLLGFIVHEGLVYFSAPEAAEIRRLDPDSGDVEVLATDVVAQALAVGSGDVFWRRDRPADDDMGEAAIMRMPVDGGDSIELVRSSTRIKSLTAAGSDLFWEEQVDWCTSTVRHLPADVTEPRQLREFSGDLRELHARPGLVFGVELGCHQGASTVWGVRLDGEDPELPWRQEETGDDAESVAVTNDFVYWSTPFPSIVYRTRRASGDAEEIWEVEADAGVVALAADETQAYWTLSDGSVYVVSHDGGAPEFLAQSNGLANWIVAEQGSVYWTTRDYVSASEFTTTLFAADSACF